MNCKRELKKLKRNRPMSRRFLPNDDASFLFSFPPLSLSLSLFFYNWVRAVYSVSYKFFFSIFLYKSSLPTYVSMLYSLLFSNFSYNRTKGTTLYKGMCDDHSINNYQKKSRRDISILRLSNGGPISEIKECFLGRKRRDALSVQRN